MFNYYKKLFMLTLRSEFAEIPQYIAKPEEKKDITISDFKKLIKEYGEDGVIVSEELNDLNDRINSIEGDTKKDLQTLLDDVTKNISFKKEGYIKYDFTKPQIEVETEFNMISQTEFEQPVLVTTPIRSAEKKKESPEDWIESKYTPEQIKALKKNFELNEKGTISDLVESVKKFQKENFLTVDGKPGTNTIKMISELKKETIVPKKTVEKTKQSLDVSKLSPEQITEKLQKYTLATKKPLEALTPEEQKTILEAINSGGDLSIRKTVTNNDIAKANKKVIGVIDLPAVNGDVTGVYSESSFKAELSKQNPILIESGIAKGFPDNIDDNGYYKLQKGDNLVIVTGERLKKMFKIEKKDEQVKKELNINDLGINFSKLDINVKKENIRIEGGKYIIDIDGVGDNLTLESISNDKFKITDNGEQISDIIIDKSEITDTILLLNDIVGKKLMHKAYKKLHNLGYKSTKEGDKIQALIDRIKSPSNFQNLKDNVKELKKSVGIEEKK